MANSCYTMYRLYGERTKELSNDIKQVQANHKEHTPNWCKWLATDLLGYTEEQINKGKIYVRGQVFFEDESENELLLDTDTAWSPCKELFDLLAEKYELDIYWMADERGCVGIWSNDIDHHVWDWKYVIYNETSGEEENFSSEEDAVEWINTYHKRQKPIKSLEEVEDDEEWFINEVVYDENY